MSLDSGGLPGGDAAHGPVWFLSTLTWLRAEADDTEGRLSLVEQLIPAGFESPWHVHRSEDESFFVMDGEVRVNVDGSEKVIGPGGFGFGPQGVPHAFRVEGTKPARVLLITNGGDFAAFVREMSVRASAPVLPEAAEPDVPKLLATAARNRIDILGPYPR